MFNFFTVPTPISFCLNFRLKGFFNWTMTYRWDSDVTIPYGSRDEIVKNVARGKHVVDDIIRNKEKLAVSFITDY